MDTCSYITCNCGCDSVAYRDRIGRGITAGARSYSSGYIHTYRHWNSDRSQWKKEANNDRRHEEDYRQLVLRGRPEKGRLDKVIQAQTEDVRQDPGRGQIYVC